MRPSIFYIIISSCVLLAVTTFVNIVIVAVLFNYCFNNNERRMIHTALCGNAGTPTFPFTWLTKEQIRRVYSPVNEDDARPGYQPANLVDGNQGTLTSNTIRNTEFDYIIELDDWYEIKKMEIVWREMGFSKENVNWWGIEARLSSNQWVTISENAEAPGNISIIKQLITTNAIRLRATSAKNAIGVYEVRFFGRLAD